MFLFVHCRLACTRTITHSQFLKAQIKYSWRRNEKQSRFYSHQINAQCVFLSAVLQSKPAWYLQLQKYIGIVPAMLVGSCFVLSDKISRSDFVHQLGATMHVREPPQILKSTGEWPAWWRHNANRIEYDVRSMNVVMLYARKQHAFFF